MKQPFDKTRRQVFLQESFAANQILRRERMVKEFHEELALPDTDKEAASLLHASAADYTFERLLLRYTAGEDIVHLRADLTGVIEAYERYQKVLGEFEGMPQIAPFTFAELGQYERCMQLIGLCYLLHRRDLLPRIAALQDPAYAGEDTLYEDLLAYELEGRFDVDEWHHDQPYRHLINCLYGETEASQIAELNAYVTTWYPQFKHVPWHDSHTRIRGTEGDYVGYWAFEAGAVAYLLDLDDTSITHMIYPRDLVKWARENRHLVEPVATQNELLRCEGGQPCPRTGWWFTPAKLGSRKLFQAGEVMPTFTTDYGATIWQWDAKQD